MHAKYTYSAGASIANVLSDLAKILSGTTDPALLSSDCDQGFTTIDDSSGVAGWELFDSNALLQPGTYEPGVVVRAPHVDDPTGYKYVWFGPRTSYLPTTSFSFLPMEDWDDVNDVGVNASTGYWQKARQVIHVDGGGFFIYATPRFFIIYQTTVEYTGGPDYNAAACCVEFTRLDYKNNPGESPSFAVGRLSWYYGADEFVTPRLGDLTNVAMSVGLVNAVKNGSQYTSVNPLPNPIDGGETTYLLHPLILSGMSVGDSGADSRRAFGGVISGLADVYITRMSSTVGDTVVVNGGDTYTAFPMGSGQVPTTLLCKIA